jgi:cytochrome c
LAYAQGLQGFLNSSYLCFWYISKKNKTTKKQPASKFSYRQNTQIIIMNRTIQLILAFCLLSVSVLSQTASDNPLKGKRILVFSKTKGYRHGSIPAGKQAIMALGKLRGFEVDTTENSALFTAENLKKYKVVVFLSTTGDVLDNTQQQAFENWFRAGNGYVGIHAASDTEYEWPWYGKMVGGYFMSHPGNPNVQVGKMEVKEKHPATDSLPSVFEKKDEFYDFKNFNPEVNVLITVDEKSYKDGKMGAYHPMAWYQEYDGGKMFYTNFGHTDETFMEALFLKHLWGGLRYVASGVTAPKQPEENRFTQTILDEKLYEPTELAVTNDGRVFYAERHGKVRIYNPKTKPSIKTVAEVPVYDKHEYGLMGVGLDPNFDTNHWIYLYYSPVTNPSDTAQRLSRFVFDEAKQMIDLSSEKVVMRVPVKRTDCCHTGGSIDWDNAGNLYLATGDDTNPFASDGYGPMDNRPNRAGWDARATSSNTNDLRGKILRIKPNNDGTYGIPAGNLFAETPENLGKVRPEIYCMGTRNSYRLSVDRHTGYVYWGDVGPDAGENSEKFGPRGHDEVNQARKAGYHGWPLFIADNRPYRQRNFENNETSNAFDPLKPINDSPHNTGLRELPAATKAFIYYPYVESPEFGAIVNKGGRNAMAGPVFYAEDYDKNSKVKFPEYYQGKFFAYDWMRDWINIVSMHPNGDFKKMERFMPNTTFSHPIDMAFGKDGSLYVLEYGPNWFAQNDEAKLSRITFNAGNRSPVVVVDANKTVGAAPLKVSFDASKSSDYDGDALKYEWNFGKGIPPVRTAKASYTFTKAGVYKPTVKITDAAGNVSTKTIEIKVGNETPQVDLVLKGNQSFFFKDQPIEYEVKVQDKEDGTLTSKKIADEDVYVSINYLEGYDKTIIAQGHQANTSFATGKRLIELSDCKACHSIDQKSIGPNYKELAKKYKGKWMIEAKLADKIIRGGGGVWGEQAMSAHPQISKDDATEMVKYILSLGDDKKASQPVKGNYMPQEQKKEGTYILTASYTDKGGNSMPPQTASKTITLKSPKFSAVAYDDQKASMKYKHPTLGREVLVATTDNSYAVYKDLDLTNISKLTIQAFSMKGTTAGGKIEVRTGSPTGTIVGTLSIGENHMTPASMPISNLTGKQDLYLIFSNADSGGKPLFALDTMEFGK